MYALVYFTDEETQIGHEGAIKGLEMESKWKFTMKFPCGPEYGGFYETKVSGADQVKSVMMDIMGYLIKVRYMTIQEYERRSDHKNPDSKKLPVANIKLIGVNGEKESGKFSLTVIGEPGEKLLDLPSLIWQQASTA